MVGTYLNKCAARGGGGGGGGGGVTVCICICMYVCMYVGTFVCMTYRKSIFPIAQSTNESYLWNGCLELWLDRRIAS